MPQSAVLESPTNAAQKSTDQKLLFLDIFRGVGIVAVVLLHLWMDLKLSSVRFIPSSEGFYANLLALFDAKRTGGELTVTWFNILELFPKLGWQAVHVFIFLSGFGLYYSYLKTRLPQQQSNSALFWFTWLKRRVNRVLPKYWVVITIIALVNVLFIVLDWKSLSAGVKELGILFAKYVLSFSLLRGFSQASFYALEGALWYVPLIIGLYLCFPFLVALLHRKGISFPKVLLLTTLIALAFRFVINLDICATPIPFQIDNGCKNPWSWGLDRMFSIHVPYGFFLGRLPEFTLGMYAAALYASGSLQQWLSKGLNRLGLLAMGTLVWGVGCLAAYYKASWPVSDTLICFGLAGMLITLFCYENLQLGKPLETAVKFLAKISYELFLIHQFVFIVLNRILPFEKIGYPLYSAIYMGTLFALAHFLHVWTNHLTIDDVPIVGRWFQRLEKQFSTKKTSVSTI